MKSQVGRNGFQDRIKRLNTSVLNHVYSLCITFRWTSPELQYHAGMSKSASLSAVKHPRYKFVVAFPETLADGSTVRRKSYFQTRQEAKGFLAERNTELASHGARHSHVADDERTAVILFRTWNEKRSEPVALLDVVKAGMDVMNKSTFTSTIRDLADARINQAHKLKLSARHRSDLDCRLARFVADFGSRPAATITSQEIEHWLHGLNLSSGSFRNYKRVIGSVWTLAIKQGAAAANPVSTIETPKIVAAAPAILSPSQLQALLSAASPEILPLLALQAFCGVRRAEAERLTWGHIHLDTQKPFIELPSAITKTSRRRTVELQPNAVAWLRMAANGQQGPLGLSASAYRDRLNAAAKIAGIEWDENLLRHSFGSYRLAQAKNVAVVSEEMGNSPDVVRKHYTNLVRPESVSDYWNILPPPAGESKILSFHNPDGRIQRAS